MSKSQKTNLIRIIVAAVLFIGVVILPVSDNVKAFLYMIPYVIVGYDVLWSAIRNILGGRIFDENFLMALATVGAIIIREFPEAVFVMLFYQVGELFQNIAVGKSRKSITNLMDICPEEAIVIRNGVHETVFPEEVSVGETILVKPGAKIPLDGIVKKGESDIDTSNMTGESVPKFVKSGEAVISGCVNISSPIEIEVTREFSDSTVSKILELVEHSAMSKGKVENFITRFARVYTPLVVILAAILAFVPPIFAGNLSLWVERALSFLVVSCPCALVISVPLSFFGGIGTLSRYGVLVKGSTYLELLEKCQVVVTDKTGTITEGRLVVEKVEGDSETMKIAQSLEQYSTHPIAKAICEKSGELFEAVNVTEISGKGVKGQINGAAVLVGNRLLMEEEGIEVKNYNASVYVAKDNKCIGSILVSDRIKDNVKESLEEAKKLGVKETVMLTGDTKEGAQKIIDEHIVDKVYSSLLPQNKVEALENIISESKGTVVYLGDGINDAPVLKRADVGIAMGQIGSDAAIEASDIVFMTDDISLLAKSISIAKKTMSIVRQNIVFSIGIKVLVLILTAIGLSGMWQAVFADVGVMVLAVLNAIRLLRM